MPRSRGEEFLQPFPPSSAAHHPNAFQLWLAGSKDPRVEEGTNQHAERCPTCRDIVERISLLPDDQRAVRLLEAILKIKVTPYDLLRVL